MFLIIYLGCDTKSKEQAALVTTRAENLEIINIDRVISEAKQQLQGNDLLIIENLELSLGKDKEDSLKIKSLKSIASFWYQKGFPLVSGHYANTIANKLKVDEMAWSICGTTFAIASKSMEDENQQKYAVSKSRLAFENALSINSEKIDNRINLALSYVDFPLQENPMKGVLMLVELNKQYPENSAVLFQLGRLALGTNQLEKAVERLSKVVELTPENKEAHCLLAEAYSKKGDSTNAQKEFEICNS